MASTKSPTYPASKDSTMFFILTEKCSWNISSVEAGTLCFISEGKYLDRLKDLSAQRTIEVTLLDSSLSIRSRVPVNALQLLTEHKAGLLYAVSDLAERWNCFQDRNTLEDAANAHVGQYVVVSVKEEMYPAIIRYIGKIHESSPLLKFFFGVELQDHGEGKGRSDGSYNHRHFFSCKTNCGLFVPFNRINFLTDRKYTEDEARSKADEVAPINHGDTVGFYLEDEVKYGTVMHLKHQSSASETLVHVLLKEKDGSKSVMWAIPMDSIIKEELLSKEPKKTCNMAIAEKPLRQSSVESNNGKLEADSSDSCFLDVNSMVQLDLQNGNPASGIIRWTGFLDDLPYKMAGVELDEDKGFTDGTWKGKQYFECPPKRGIFVKQKACQPDMRFHSSSDALPLKADVFSGPTSPLVLENQPPLTNGSAVLVLKGTMKGIQGHCNSCYMDAALFSLFSCTSVLDSMLFMPANPADVPIQNILRDEIVNPLRRNGFVSANNVMKLRHHLTKESQCPSFATSEKDPEEFLNLIMHHILGIEPLLKLQSGMQKEQECYCYQIFMEKQEDMVVPDVQQLVAHSFLSSDLKLAEIPSCFIIQMPRFGKNYKMFNKIIPSLELDITDLLFESPRECIVCGELATKECPECFKDAMFSNALIKQYCEKCCTQAHTHHKRKGHKPRILKNPAAFESTHHPHASRIPREKMELFAVLCIETSHYVSFVKYGPEKEDWMFFDSMADRYDENGGYNIPEVTLCPEVAKYLESPVADLAEKRPRDMEGVAKRLFCDAYMYMYQSKKMALYK